MGRFPLIAVLFGALMVLAVPAMAGLTHDDAYDLLKEGSDVSVRALPAGEREILMATLALEQGRSDEVIALLDNPALVKNPVAARLRAEAYRRQSLQAAARAGRYAHAIKADIGKLENASIAVTPATDRLALFLRQWQAAQSARPVVAVASIAVIRPFSTPPLVLKPSALQPVNRAKAPLLSAKRPAAVVAKKTKPNVVASASPVTTPVAVDPVPVGGKSTLSTVTNTVVAAVKPMPKSQPQPVLPAIRRMLETWRQDWQSRHHDRYIAHYHLQFSSDKYDYNAWARYKERVNSAKSFIRINISDVQLIKGPVQSRLGEIALIQFRQQYVSNNYKATSRKQMYLVRSNQQQGWQILSEGNPGHVRLPYTTNVSVSMQPPVVKWLINLASFDHRQAAVRMADSVRAQTGADIYVSDVLAAGRRVSRVRSGHFNNKAAAQSAMQRLCRQLALQDCWLEDWYE